MILSAMMPGFFITFEGGEGAGKTVQAQILASHLRSDGYQVLSTREPGGTRIGEQVRAITHNQENADLNPIAEAYLMAASRAQHVAEIIKPALAEGKIVICDRFLDSSLAYQGYGRQLGEDVVNNLNKLAVTDVAADLTILLNVPLDVGLARRGKEVKVDRLDLQQRDFYERVHAGYLTLAKRNSSRYVVIDAAKTPEEVAARIWQTVRSALEKRNGKQ